MGLLTTVSVRLRVAGQIKLNQLLESSEADFGAKTRELESKAIFRSLYAAGVVQINPYSKARFAERRCEGRALRATSTSISDVLDGRGELVQLIERMGQEAFSACFLGVGDLSDQERAQRCDISLQDAERLRAFVDDLYLRGELENSGQDAAGGRDTGVGPGEPVLSAVAAIDVSDGHPVLGFFNRDIWKGRYHINQEKRVSFLGTLSPQEVKRADSLLKQLEFCEIRKSTLYRLLHLLVDVQRDYFLSRDPARRTPLTQASAAVRLGVDPSTINRLIAKKCIQLPWGLEAPLRVLFPSTKTLMLDRLYDVIVRNVDLRDEGIRRQMAHQFGAHLSRQSITQYRKELCLPSRDKRAITKAP